MLTANDLPSCINKKGLARKDALLLALAVDIQSPKSVAQVRHLCVDAGALEVKRCNISEYLRHAKGLAYRGKNGWLLTESGKDHVRGLLPGTDQPMKQAAASLRAILQQISSRSSREFVEEAILCHERGLVRASIVLSWVGAMSVLHEEVASKHMAQFNSVAPKFDPRWVKAHNAAGLTLMKESSFLDATGPNGIALLDKNTVKELKGCLDRRNACGHPSPVKYGPNVVAAHVEVLALNVFAKYH